MYVGVCWGECGDVLCMEVCMYGSMCVRLWVLSCLQVSSMGDVKSYFLSDPTQDQRSSSGQVPLEMPYVATKFGMKNP